MNKEIYWFPDIGATFCFGKHKNQLLCDVIADDPTYLTWCFSNVDNFLISQQTIEQIKLLFPKFPITDTVLKHVGDASDYSDYLERKEDSVWANEVDTYEKYGGSYAQDVMGYSDDDIDTIFDGDPDAYWNID